MKFWAPAGAASDGRNAASPNVATAVLSTVLFYCAAVVVFFGVANYTIADSGSLLQVGRGLLNKFCFALYCSQDLSQYTFDMLPVEVIKLSVDCYSIT